MKKLFCKIGLHHYEYVKGIHNKYYECKHCGHRKVKIPIGGYQPIDKKWLKEKK